MLETNQFTSVLHAWVEVFMRRSMRDLLQFAKNSGVSMPQLNTLMYLSHHGSCGVSGIGNHLGVTSAAASQMIDRLVQQGYLERTEDPEDRRSKQITVTAKGRSVIEEGIEVRRHWMEELSAALDPEDHELIIHALNLLTKAASSLEPVTSVVEEELL